MRIPVVRGGEAIETAGLPCGRDCLRRFAFWFGPVALLIALGTIVIAHFAAKDCLNAFNVPETSHVYLASEVLDEAIARPIQHMRSLAFREKAIRHVLDERGDRRLGPLEEAFTTLLSRNPSYAQMRWIADDGAEIARVERTSRGNIRTVPRRQLQNKRGRYYFIDTLRQERGAIYISPLDLNIEHGRIEVPYRPMIRVGARVFRSDGTPVGMFILNIAARAMLAKFAERAMDSDIVLLDADGYWLYSRRTQDEWGFMFGRRETFGLRHPAIWRRVSSADSGQVLLASGLWTWRTVRFLPDNAGAVTPVEWKAVSRISPAQLAAVRNRVWFETGAGGVVLLLLFGWGIWRLVREMAARQWAEEGFRRERAFLSQANSRLAGEIEERKNVQAQLERNNGELQVSASVLNNITEGVLVTTPDGTVRSVNPACCVMTGYQADELVGRKPNLLKSDRHDAAFYAGLWQSLERDGYWQGEIWNRRKDSTLAMYRETITAVRDHLGGLQYYVAVLTDITESKRSEDAIRYQAYHDALTGLPNRVLLMDRIRLHMAYANRNGRRLAVLFIDLDGFKAVNDTFGHDGGDTVLRETAVRLSDCLRESDTLARLGGDEFVAVLNDVDGPDDAATVAQKMLEMLAPAFSLTEGRQVRLSASIGIAVYPDAGETDQQLLNAADAAMYAAKQQGKAAYVFARAVRS